MRRRTPLQRRELHAGQYKDRVFRVFQAHRSFLFQHFHYFVDLCSFHRAGPDDPVCAVLQAGLVPPDHVNQ